MTPTTLECPRCGGPTAHRAPFCAYCRAPLTWSRLFDVNPGDPVAALDLSRDPLDGAPAGSTRDAFGVVIGKDAAGTVGPRMRDACVLVRAAVLGAEACFGVVARSSVDATERYRVTHGYKLEIRPQVRGFHLYRELALPGTMGQRSLSSELQYAPAIRKELGEANEVELRFADEVFQVLFNGELAFTALDAGLSYGHAGWFVRTGGREGVRIERFVVRHTG